ncbi:hypothetical protein Bca4012_064004 [Brassica carinata]|uniref:RNase H type-1 domain-containing protein n=1 Tax=Brassica carinata TaxID=52824 RepID=A0A8X7SF27_BRACI|nr:hypothetical protein Bca52824_033493 [Brassica carinata]
MIFQCPLARQVWAEADIPHPEHWYHETSIYQNINYLMEVKQRRIGETEKKRAWPWVVWNIWKSRNDLFFKGIRWSAKEIATKAFKDSEEWFLAQIVEEEISQAEPKRLSSLRQKWNPLPKDWKMCNIAYEWDKSSGILGLAWVLRNHRGVVLLHSRSSYAQILNKENAKMQLILWAVENIASLHIDKVIFAGEYGEEFGATLRPREWPVFAFQADEIRRALLSLNDTQLLVVPRNSNRGVSFIAQSVIRERRHHSYVAAGPPGWIFEMFVNESRNL